MTYPPLKVLLGISGGIAAIKAPEIVRRLRENGHQIRCILTRNAQSFVTPLTLEVLSGHPVLREEYLQANDSGRELHIEMGRWADVLCIAPATCNTLARLALGLADDFLSTTVLVFEGPIVMAPAMSTEMWAKSIVQQHVGNLVERGVRVIGPETGPLATGEIGHGRMTEPADIVAGIEAIYAEADLAGRTVLITAGPTREALDPVRFLSNRSTGKMGFSLAAEAAARGARTLLVAGPVELPTPPGVDRFDVESAVEMETAVHGRAGDADLIIMTAAVSDFRPTRQASEKLKKTKGTPEVLLERNPDILQGLAEVAPRAIRVGFAAETRDLEEEGQRKLAAKDAHFIVANDVSREDIGFGSDENEVVVFSRTQDPIRIARQDKRQVARHLFDLFLEALHARETGFVGSDR